MGVRKIGSSHFAAANGCLEGRINQVKFWTQGPEVGEFGLNQMDRSLKGGAVED